MRSANQKERLQKLKQGEGTFVYRGGAFDTEAVPGIPYIGKDGNQARSVVFTTVEDADGKKVQIVDPKSSDKGDLVWKKAPQFNRTEMKSYRMRIGSVVAKHEDGVGLVAKTDANGKVPKLFLEFAAGKPVFVGDPRMALKLRCLPFFEEVFDKGDLKKSKVEEAKA